MKRVGTLTSFARIIFLALVGLIPAGAKENSSLLERPIPEGGGPTEVECVMGVLDIDDISEADQNFTVNVIVRFSWHDPRLAHEGPGFLKKQFSEIWHPNLIFLNRQLIWASMGKFALVSPEGEVTFRQQFWGDFSQPMDLHDFPFDEQTFGIQVVSTGSDEQMDIKLVKSTEVPSFVTENYSVASWDVTGHGVDTSDYEIPGVGTFPSFHMSFTAKRYSHHYLIKVVAPLLLIVFLSQLVFWLSPTEGGSQLGVSVTSFLTVIAYHVALSSKLPEIPYLTNFDVFVFLCTILVALAMIEVVITTGLAQRDKVDAARKMDRICRVAFPGLTILGTMYAFLWH